MKQVIIMIMCIGLMSSCTQQESDKTFFISEAEHEIRNNNLETVDGDEGTIAEYDTDVSLRSSGAVYYNVPPYQGCPSETVYPFIVKDWGDEEPISIKLIAPQGTVYYIPLLRAGIYQYRFLNIHTPGRWEWRYVFTSSQQPTQPGYGYYYKDNTLVTIESNGFLSTHWPFTDETCWVETCGPGCNAHTTGNGEYYAQDWACSSGTYGKPFYAMLDGVVTKVAYAPTTYGNYVDITQQIGTKQFKARIAHLSSVSVTLGEQVFGGSTKIGELGSTGNSTGPHAHCSVFDITGIQESIPFDFDPENTVCE